MLYVQQFAEVDKTSLSLVGGKGANLGELIKIGLIVPKGFCVTTYAYSVFVCQSAEVSILLECLAKADANDLDGLARLGEQIRASLLKLAFPEDVSREIELAIGMIGLNCALAIRSSATAEDLPSASFAGQQDTYLNIENREEVLSHIKKCWVSLFNDRAIIYRAKHGFDHRKVSCAVVVQEMVYSEVSGVMFTADPINGNRKVVSINASFGLGEAIVSGVVSPDLYQVRNNILVKQEITDKRVGVFPHENGGTEIRDISKNLGESPALSENQVLALVTLGEKIAEHFGSPQDVEWGLCNGEFHILQSRPITSLYPVPPIDDSNWHVFFSLGHQQMMTDAMKPLAISMLRTYLPYGKSTACEESSLMVSAGGRLFIDGTKLLQIRKLRKFLAGTLKSIDELMSSAIMELAEREVFAQNRSAKLRMVSRITYTILPFAGKVMRNIWFRNPAEALIIADSFTERVIRETEKNLGETSGAERILYIQESLGNLAESCMVTIAHYQISSLMILKMIERLCEKWLGVCPELQHISKSIPGNVTSEMGLALGDLADITRGYPGIMMYLAEADDQTFFEGLIKLEGGAVFTAAFARFLEKYGMRCAGEIDIARTRWSEAPTHLVGAMLSHIKTSTPGEHREKFRIGALEAEEAMQKILEHLVNTRRGWLKRKYMLRLFKAYRNLMSIREHPKYIVIQHLGIYRQAILEEASRLVSSGVINSVDDVFYLSIEELLLVVTGKFSGELRKIITERQENQKVFEKLTPPRVITSEGEVITGRYGLVEAPSGALVGTPVSAGIHVGRAKVVLKPEDAKLERGDILVAPFTDPGWTPLFLSVKGLIIEVGGVMTHGAVVAREYGIPAVAGIDRATKIIKDGQLIRINGDLGYVELLDG